MLEWKFQGVFQFLKSPKFCGRQNLFITCHPETLQVFLHQRCRLYWNKGPHERKHNTLGKLHAEIFTNLQSDRCGKAGTWELGLNVEM
jgi:hypothetical protein